MTTAPITGLEQKRERGLDELHHLPDLMRGKGYERGRKCGGSSCPCASGGPRHPGRQLTVNLAGRTRTRYVRRGERAAVAAKVAAYRRLWELVEELTEVNLTLLNAVPLEAEGQ